MGQVEAGVLGGYSDILWRTALVWDILVCVEATDMRTDGTFKKGRKPSKATVRKIVATNKRKRKLQQKLWARMDI